MLKSFAVNVRLEFDADSARDSFEIFPEAVDYTGATAWLWGPWRPSFE
jgi:hypothetical protein